MISDLLKKATRIIGVSLPRWGLLVLAALLALSLVRNIIRIAAANSKVEEARKKVEELKTENENLKDEVEGVTSSEFAEKTARDKLGLAKEGETVVVLPDQEEIKKLAPRLETGEEYLPDPNWKRWLKLFL